MLHSKPSECIVFEDSINGIKAGLAAGIRVDWCQEGVGMTVVAVPSTEIPQDNLVGVNQVIRTLSDFDETKLNLPSMKDVLNC